MMAEVFIVFAANGFDEPEIAGVFATETAANSKIAELHASPNRDLAVWIEKEPVLV